MTEDIKPKKDPCAEGKKKRRLLSPEKKFQVFLESQTGKTPVGEVLRREGIYSTDLARTHKQVKEAALDRLSVRPGAKPKTVPQQCYEVLKRELEEKDRALAEQAQYLLEEALIKENILDLPEDQRPEVINNRGRQMKAKTIKNMFEDHNMPQLFARPRTPDDNPFVESLFSTVKRAPQYPGRFLDHEQATEYFNRYFLWYNMEHLHSGIDYVTPQQCHQGLGGQIVARRRADLNNQRRFRKEVNRQK